MFPQIAFVTDNIEIADSALEYIVSLFQETKISVLSIVDQSRAVPDSTAEIYSEVARDHSIDVLAHAFRKLEALGIEAETVMLKGNPVRQVLKFIAERKIELLILETYDKFGQQISHTEKLIVSLIKKAKCSIMILTSVKGLREPARILWLLEGSRTYHSDEPIEAIGMAKQFDGMLTLLHVFPTEAAKSAGQAQLDQSISTIKGWAAEAELECTTVIETGDLNTVLTRLAAEHDLVFIDRIDKAPLNTRNLTKHILADCPVPIAIDKN